MGKSKREKSLRQNVNLFNIGRVHPVTALAPEPAREESLSQLIWQLLPLNAFRPQSKEKMYE
jgi:hypothetical protein